MNIDLGKAIDACKGIEQVQERTNTGVVSILINNNYFILFV